MVLKDLNLTGYTEPNFLPVFNIIFLRRVIKLLRIRFKTHSPYKFFETVKIW